MRPHGVVRWLVSQKSIPSDGKMAVLRTNPLRTGCCNGLPTLEVVYPLLTGKYKDLHKGHSK